MGSLTTGNGSWPPLRGLYNTFIFKPLSSSAEITKDVVGFTPFSETNHEKSLLQHSTSHSDSQIHPLCNTSEPRWTWPQHLSHKIIQKRKKGLYHVFSMPFGLSRISGTEESVFFQDKQNKRPFHHVFIRSAGLWTDSTAFSFLIQLQHHTVFYLAFWTTELRETSTAWRNGQIMIWLLLVN